MSGLPAFPYLSDASLAAFDQLMTPMHIFSFGNEQLIWANRQGLDVWNASSVDELRQRDLRPFSDATRIRLAEYRLAFERGEDRTETWALYPEGIAKPRLSHCFGISIEGHPQAMFVEHLLHADKLSMNELRTLEAIRHTPLMISLHEMSGSMLLRNPSAAAKFADFDKAIGAVGDHFRAMFADPDEAERLLVNSSINREANTTTVMNLKGSPSHTIAISLVTDPGTGGQAILVRQRDVTESIEAQRRLAASEEALHLILSLNENPVLVIAVADGALLLANSAAENALCKAFESDLTGIFEGADTFKTLCAELLAGSKSTWQLRMRGSNNRLFWASLSGIRIRFRDADAITLIITDIDTFKADITLGANPEDFERQIGAIQRKLLAIASHEFRTPLAIIDSAVQRIESRVNAIQKANSLSDALIHLQEVSARSSRIRNKVRRLTRIIEDTLHNLGAAIGQMAFYPVQTDVAEFIRAFAQGYAESHPRLKVIVDGDISVNADIDHDLFSRVLTNLFSNAEKYTDGPAELQVKLTLNERNVFVYFRDFGIGIPQQEQALIFDDFLRGSNAVGRSGTGLGLAISRQIMTIHDGEIEIVENLGPGTTFRIRFPRPTATNRATLPTVAF